MASEVVVKHAGSLAGYWHLVAADCPEHEIPHRVDQVFRDDAAGLHGAVLSRRDGSEIPLQEVACIDGELRLKMSAPPGQPAADPPVLVMTAVADRFEGAWDTPGTEHVQLKLIRARDASQSIHD